VFSVTFAPTVTSENLTGIDPYVAICILQQIIADGEVASLIVRSTQCNEKPDLLECHYTIECSRRSVKAHICVVFSADNDENVITVYAIYIPRKERQRIRTWEKIPRPSITMTDPPQPAQ
jgi:hypothetical protein